MRLITIVTVVIPALVMTALLPSPGQAASTQAANKSLGRVMTQAVLQAERTASYPTGVWRHEHTAGDGGAAVFYKGQTGTCASQTPAMVSDGGGCFDTTSGDGNSFKAQFSGKIDIRSFGIRPSAYLAADSTMKTNNRDRMAAALAYIKTFGGRLFVPSLRTGYRFELAGGLSGMYSWGTCIQAFNGMAIEGERPGGVGTGGVSYGDSEIYCEDGDGISSPDTARVNNVLLQDLKISGNAPWSTQNYQTSGIHYGFGTGWNLVRTTVENFVVCYDTDFTTNGGGGQNHMTYPICNQQFGYPNTKNGYPLYGWWVHGGHGQNQTTNLDGGAFYPMQVVGATPQMNPTAATPTADGVTTTFQIDLEKRSSTLLKYRLWRARSVIARINNTNKQLGVDYTLSDATSGAPSTTIYAAYPLTQTTRGSRTVTVDSATGLPSSITCSGTDAYPCDPLIFLDDYGIPPGSYLTSVSGTTLTFDNPQHAGAYLTDKRKRLFDQGNIAGRPGCDLTLTNSAGTALTSKCGRLINVIYSSAPTVGQTLLQGWEDPWGMAGIYFDSSAGGIPGRQYNDTFNTAGTATGNILKGFEVGSYARAIVDIGSGNNVIHPAYIQISYKCADIWAPGDFVHTTVASSFSNPDGCKTALGATSQTLNQQSKLELENVGNVTDDAWLPRNLFVCGDLYACPWARGISFTGVSSTPVRTAEGWVGYTGAGGNATVSAGGGPTIQIQRPSGNTNTTTHCVAQALRSVAATRLLGPRGASLSFYATAGDNFSGLDGDGNAIVNVVVAIGTTADEGIAGFAAGTWTGYQELLNTTVPAYSRNYAFHIDPPDATQELGVKWCYTPSGTAGTNDYVKIGQPQIEYGLASSSFEFQGRAIARQIAESAYEHSYVSIKPGTASTYAGVSNLALQTTSAFKPGSNVRYRGMKICTSPTLTLYAPETGNTGNYTLTSSGADVPITTFQANRDGFYWKTTNNVTAGSLGDTITGHWAASCEP